MAAAVDRRARFDAHEAIAAGGILVRGHLQAAHDTVAVQHGIVVPELVDVVPLLVGEVTLDEQLPGEVVIACERAERALRAARRAGLVIVVMHTRSPPFSSAWSTVPPLSGGPPALRVPVHA